LPTITSDALITAKASSPTARRSSSAAALVIELVTAAPPPGVNPDDRGHDARLDPDDLAFQDIACAQFHFVLLSKGDSRRNDSGPIWGRYAWHSACPCIAESAPYGQSVFFGGHIVTNPTGLPAGNGKHLAGGRGPTTLTIRRHQGGPLRHPVMPQSGWLTMGRSG
jgi:hypothetical protein